MSSKKYVVYHQSRSGLGTFREVILGQALDLLKIRYDIVKSQNKGGTPIHLIDEIVAACDEACAVSFIGIVFSESEEYPYEETADWILKEIIDRELYLLSGTWALDNSFKSPRGEFFNDFKLVRKVSVD